MKFNSKKSGISEIKKAMLKLYRASPPKVQFALAKYGLKNAVKKNKAKFEELIRH